MSDLNGPEQPHLGHSRHPRGPIHKLSLGHPGLLWMDVESMPWATDLQPYLLVDPSDPHLSPSSCSSIALPCHGCCRPQLCPLLRSMGVGMISWGSPLLNAPWHLFSTPRLLTIIPGTVNSNGGLGTTFTETFWICSHYWQFGTIMCLMALIKLYFNKWIT